MQNIIKMLGDAAAILIPVGTVVSVISIVNYMNQPNKLEVPLCKEIKLSNGQIIKERYHQIRVGYHDVDETIKDYTNNRGWSYVSKDPSDGSHSMLTFKKIEE